MPLSFHYDYRDKQLQTIFFDPVFAQLLRVENIPRSKVTGFDADVTLRPVRGVTLSSAVDVCQLAGRHIQ